MVIKSVSPASFVSGLKQDAYTGENRCLPCTLVNVALALVISIAVAIFSPTLGIVLFAVSLATIYLRGYLIPGTPELTKQYFPNRFLQWFDKDAPQSQQATTEGSLDFENRLLHEGILQPTEGGMDIVLSSEFQTQWSQYLDGYTDDPDRDQLREALDGNIEDGVFSGIGDTLTLSQAGTLVGQWPSPAAVKADLAAAEVCSDWISGWGDFYPIERATFLRTIRVANSDCPVCDGAVELQEDTRETCCNSYDIIVASCQTCESRIFEIDGIE